MKNCPRGPRSSGVRRDDDCLERDPRWGFSCGGGCKFHQGLCRNFLGQELTLITSSPTIPTYTMEGQWTDMVIASGDQLYTNNGSTGFAAGPVVTTTGLVA